MNLLAKRCSVHSEVYGKGGENTEPMTQGEEALRPPGLEASPPMLQTLCLLAMNTNLSKSSHPITVDFLEKAQKTQPPQLSQVTSGKPILKASEKNGEQLQKKIMNNVNENTHFPESPELLAQEIARWKQSVQEMEEEKERLVQSNTLMEQVLNDNVRQLTSMAECLLKAIPLPNFLGDHLLYGNLKGQWKREAENGDQSIHQSEADLQGVIDDVDFIVSLQSPE